MELLLAREAAVLLACAIAAYTDMKTGLIYDWITLPLIVFGIALNLMEWNLLGFAVGAIVFGLGYAIYWFGKIGGGDVKLFTGIALVLPFLGRYPFIAMNLVVAGLIAIIFLGVYYTAKYARKGMKIEENKQGIMKALLFAIVFAVYFWYLGSRNFFTIFGLGVIGIPIAFALVFLAFEQGIRKNIFLKRISVGELEEDEIIAAEYLDEKERKALELHGKGILGEKEKKKLEEIGIKEVPVYRNLPKFAPFVFIGALVVIIAPNFLELVFNLP